MATKPGKAILPKLAALALVFLSATLLPSCRKKPKNLLLITVDTLRADHLGCYGYKDIETPNIDRLAGAGDLFENARSSVPLTLPSHATIMTGLYPTATGVRANLYDSLGGRAVTMAEILKQNGYNTAAILGSYVLHNKFGLAQGFDHYDDLFLANDKLLATGYPERKAEEVAGLGIEWLRKEGKRGKFFLWLHFYDPHSPYIPPEPYLSRYADRPYDGEIAYTDYHIGRVLEELSRLGLGENTAIILAGDHGEGLDEHGEKAHGIFTYDTTLKVPLIIKSPGWAAGARSTETASLIDLFPTALAIMGIDPPRKEMPESIQGRNLALSQKAGPREVYFESRYAYDEYGWAPLRGIVAGKYKYISAPHPELYDLEDDPMEENNLATLEASTARKFDNRLASLVASVTPEGGDLAEKPEISAKDVENLRDLGYFGAPPQTDTDEFPLDLPDPKDLLQVAQAIVKSRGFLNTDQPKIALQLLKKVESLDPDNRMLLLLIGSALEKSGDLKQAIGYYRRMVNIKPNDMNALASLFVPLVMTGELDEAQKVLKTLTAYYPFDPANIKYEAMLLQARKRFDEAEARFREFIKRDERDPEGHFGLGAVLQEKGDYEGAIIEYRTAVYYDSDYKKALQYLGRLLVKTGKTGESFPILERLIKLDPDNASAYNTLGWAYMETGSPREAIENFTKAVSLNPGDLDSLENIAYISNFVHAPDAGQRVRDYLREAERQNTPPENIKAALERFQAAKEGP